MNKKWFIINGSAGKGKDKFVEFCSKYIKVKNISTVDKVKEAGVILGWKGEKSERDREFLSDLKILADKYYSSSLVYTLHEFEKFTRSEEESLFVHCREPENIDLLKGYLSCKTILIQNSNIKDIKSNMADANVNNYKYDFYIDNSGTLEELELLAKEFVEKEILI